MDNDSNSKIGADFFLKVPVKPVSSEKRHEEPSIPKLKVELHTINLSDDSQKLVMDTLRHINGDDFCLNEANQYVDLGSNLYTRYWKDRGNLIVQSGTDYSNIKDENRITAMEDKFRAFAVSKLENYGFHRNHCVEALDHTNGDVASSLELLYFKYYNLTKRNIDCTLNDQELLSQRCDEKDVLLSIYEESFVEKDLNKIWSLTLKLDNLLKYSNSIKKLIIKDEKAKTNNKKNVEKCRNFAKGKCKFGIKCRFLHEIVETKPSKEELVRESVLFNLEIRFTENSKYPFEPPMIFLTTTHKDFPDMFCMHLCKRLITEAQNLADDGIACVFSLVELLKNEEDMDEFISSTKIKFIDCTRMLFADAKTDRTKVENNLPTHHAKGSTGREHRTVNNSSKLKDDGILATKFFEKQSNARYKEFIAMRKQLPAWCEMQHIIDVVEKSQVVVISGETGCGKSTQVGQFLLDDWLINRSPESHLEIVCTQPRRLSAIGVAERVAQERDERCGNSIGYQIRLESKTSRMTRLTFCTTGILLRRFLTEKNLDSITHVIVDEVHERSEESDFLLMMLKDLLKVRKDLKVILMSATLNAKNISEYFGGVPTLEIPGRTYPVEQLFLEDILDVINFNQEDNSQYTTHNKKKIDTINHLEELITETAVPSHTIRDENLNISQICARYKGHTKLTYKNLYLMDPDKINPELIERVLEYICVGNHDWPKEGSILIFLPGISEISTVMDHLKDNHLFKPRTGQFLLLPLHSTLGSEEQSAIFKKPPRGVRKIVLSTNIAETSITIDDCVFVIDCGKMKEKRFDSGRNMESLDMVWVSRANALQRKGRAGRVMPGVCIHLYTSHRFNYHFLKEPVPEIHRIPLEPLILRIKTMELFCNQNLYEVLEKTLEPPSRASITSAINRLRDVGALDLEDNLSPLGHHLAALPVDVRIGKLMLLGAIFHCVDSALTMAACLSYKTPFCSPFGKKDQADNRKRQFATGNSDQLTVLRAYQKWQEVSKISHLAAINFSEENFLSYKTLTALADIKQQLLELLVSIGFVPITMHPSNNNGKDRILELTGNELNVNSKNFRLLSAILSAALYPNIVKVFTPEKSFEPSASGAIPRLPKSGELKFKTKADGYVHIHPSSVNYTVGHFSSPYLVFQEKVKTSKVFIRDCSMVAMLPLVLFSSHLEVELQGGDFIISIEKGWILFKAFNHRIAEMLKHMRQELLQLLEEKIKDPYLNLLNHDNGNKIINTIVTIISKD
ncbi:putative ATP-dependent RNA helicase DHX57 [Ctenocephalides felis]|uniref:putative ATP-dependent RNA helicase DHX57 n=1 Tax=Ctenocephalides felis TaxID=7515 RepID=UPI000E6E3301|nr:putative ATP-dependent RNA helicase DHX57 [Ctenocephalides felis]